MSNRILVVDDDPVNRAIVRRILGDAYELEEVSSGEECLARFRQVRPKVVLLDVNMPGMDGYETCRRLKARPDRDLTEVVLVSAKASTEERLRGYEAGADDYIIKPFEHEELRAKVKVHFRLAKLARELTRRHEDACQKNTDLEEVIADRTIELVRMRNLTVLSLAKLAESRDPETGAHLERMSNYCRLIAEILPELGHYRDQIDANFIETLYCTSPLHDIGKVGIPDVILLKPGRLTDAEFEVMKRHTVIGANTLQEAASQLGTDLFLCMAAEIARWHHERYDGTGYPDGLVGDNIPLAARIVAVADVYDALTSVRVYKEAFDEHVAFSMIVAQAGKQFDPHVVEAMQAGFDKIQLIQRQYQDHHVVRGHAA